MVAGGCNLTVADPALQLHFLHLLVDQLLDKERVLHVFQHQRGRGSVGGQHCDRSHAEQALPQIASGIDVPHPVKKDFIVLDVQKSLGQEQPILGQLIAGKGQGHPQMTLAVFPKVFNGNGHCAFLPFFFSLPLGSGLFIS